MPLLPVEYGLRSVLFVVENINLEAKIRQRMPLKPYQKTPRIMWKAISKGDGRPFRFAGPNYKKANNNKASE